MAARITRLRTKADRLLAEQAEELRRMVLEYPDLPERARGEIIRAIDTTTAASDGWAFVMLSPAQNRAVGLWLLDHSSRPQKAIRLWMLLFEHLRRDTGEIMLTRDEMADAIGETADNVSTIMHELAGVGAIIVHREKVPGMRGRGRAVYLMNPNVGTHLPGAARDKAQAVAPVVRLVEPVPAE